ncbi:hypothetical protein HY087_00005, partial [Candidatus Gottesmanbacteria bacterium]|nr:hypothetical protein [Candidatus Gottesmanbacteria bacterium]
MDPKTIKKRVLAAADLLSSPTLSKQKVDDLATLLSGINPKLDYALGEIKRTWGHLDKLQAGEVVELTLEALPTYTEKDKKRKKYLLLLLSLWKDLKAEVKRVEAQAVSAAATSSAAGKAGSLWNVIAGAKGPLGLVTILAVGWVALQATAVTITIKNNGCDPINPVVNLPFPIAGISLPKETIPDGGSGIASLPPLQVTVDGSASRTVRLTALSISMNFDLGSPGISLSFNGAPLL